jgi:GxxExxY protein
MGSISNPPAPDDLEELVLRVVASAQEVHDKIGAGMPAEAYGHFLEIELNKRGCNVKRNIRRPIVYDGSLTDKFYTIDMLVDDRLVLGVRAADSILPTHKHQLLSFLKHGGYELGLLINFNEVKLQDGIIRVIN